MLLIHHTESSENTPILRMSENTIFAFYNGRL